MRFPPKIFLMMLALIVTLTAYRSVEMKVQGIEDARVRDEILLEHTHKGARKDGVISAPGQEMNIEQRKEKDSPEDEVEARFMPAEIAISELDADAWMSARPVTI